MWISKKVCQEWRAIGTYGNSNGLFVDLISKNYVGVVNPFPSLSCAILGILEARYKSIQALIHRLFQLTVNASDVIHLLTKISHIQSANEILLFQVGIQLLNLSAKLDVSRVHQNFHIIYRRFLLTVLAFNAN